jgi:hypothetical protein
MRKTSSAGDRVQVSGNFADRAKAVAGKEFYSRAIACINK